MANSPISAKRQVLNHLVNGGSITPAKAMSRFGVKNLRALMSNIRTQVEAFGNWEVITYTTTSGKTEYSMNDTHPGTRTYSFRKDGTRFIAG